MYYHLQTLRHSVLVYPQERRPEESRREWTFGVEGSSVSSRPVLLLGSGPLVSDGGGKEGGREKGEGRKGGTEEREVNRYMGR